MNANNTNTVTTSLATDRSRPHRRALLAGLAAIVPTAAIASTIPAVSAPTADGELIALGQKISELRILERKAYEEVDRHADTFDAIKPEKPHVLLWRPDDPMDLPPDIGDYIVSASMLPGRGGSR